MTTITNFVPASITSWLNDGELGRGFIKSTIGSVVVRAVGTVATFLIGIQLARYLGPEGYGLYGLVISLVAILAVPAQFGIPQLLTREISASLARENWGELLGIIRWSARTVAGLSIATAALAFLAFNLWPTSLDQSFKSAFVVGLIFLPILALTNVAGAGLRGFHRVVIGQVPGVLVRPFLFSFLLFFWMSWFGQISPPEAIIALVLAAVIALSFGWTVYWTTASKIEFQTKPLFNTNEWLSSSFKMSMTEGLRVIDGHSAILLLGLIASVEGVGHYRVAASIAAFALLPISITNLAAGPFISRLYAKGDTARLRQLAAIAASVMTGGVIVLSLPFFIAGNPIISGVFGGEYGPATDVLLLLLLAQILNSSFGFCAMFLNMTGHEGHVTRALAFSLPINILLILFLVPRLGIEGAALAYVCGILVWNITMWRDAKRLTSIDTSLLSLARLARK